MTEDFTVLLFDIKKSLIDIVTAIDKYLGKNKQVLLNLEEIQLSFPTNLRNILIFEDSEKYFIVRPRRYLGKEPFIKIASIVNDQLNGEYVSAGKQSHFKISKDNIVS